MCSLDSKGVFTDGFSDLQARLDEKFYTSVQAFRTDMAAAMSEVVSFAPISTVGGDAEHDMNRIQHGNLTAEQKETKKLLKRINKGLHPHFEEALRREADLAGRSYEEQPDLEALLNLAVQRRTSALSTESIRQTTETEQPLSKQHDHLMPDGEAEAVAAKAEDVQLAPTPDDNAADPHRTAHDEAADEAAIAAQLGQDAMHASFEQPQSDAMDLDHDENNGQTLTPPRSEKNLNPLGNGGIPWYLEPFDIHGTTVYEERYTGREVLRDMSEELSELDDDILDGLADSDPVRPSDAPDSNVAEVKKVVARKKQRRRGW
jgi:NuA3 HAT complex component NTO1